MLPSATSLTSADLSAQVEPPPQPCPPRGAPAAVGHVVPVPRDRCGYVRGRVADIKVSWRVEEGDGTTSAYLNGRLGLTGK